MPKSGILLRNPPFHLILPMRLLWFTKTYVKIPPTSNPSNTNQQNNKSPTKTTTTFSEQKRIFHLLPWTYHPGEPQRPCRRVTSFHAPLSTAPCRPPGPSCLWTGPPRNGWTGQGPLKKMVQFLNGAKNPVNHDYWRKSILFHFFEIRKSHRLKIAFVKRIYMWVSSKEGDIYLTDLSVINVISSGYQSRCLNGNSKAGETGRGTRLEELTRLVSW